MRYSQLSMPRQSEQIDELPGWPALMNPLQAERFVGGPAIFAAMCEQGWVRPVVQQHRLTRYHHKNLAIAVDRLVSGEKLVIGRSSSRPIDSPK